MARAAATRSTRRTTSRADDGNAPSGRLGGVLRDSMSSVMGTVGGLNLPLRSVERLTGALERASAMLERIEDAGGSTRIVTILKRVDRITKSVEQSTKQLDKLDADFVKRLNKALTVLVEMRDDTRAMRARLESLEGEVHSLQTAVTRVPLLRPSRRSRRAAQAAEEQAAP